MNEMRSSMAFVRSPVFSCTELVLPLPSCRGLWDARNATQWQQLFLAKLKSTASISILDAMNDVSRLELERDTIDGGMSAHIVLYALWSRVWGFLDAKSYYQRSNTRKRKASSILWLEAQHEELYAQISTIKENLAKQDILTPECELVSELMMMFLHVNSQDIQKFAGRFGEEEVRAALPLLQVWMHHEEHRYAVWHAGQVLRAARKLPPTQLRGFLAIAVYHACLTLWVTVMLTNRSGLTTRRNSPQLATADGNAVSGRQTSDNVSPCETGVPVMIDGEGTQASRAYMIHGEGRPALMLNGVTRRLSDPSTISQVMLDVFKTNYPAKSASLPPLLENLSSLMTDLSATLAREMDLSSEPGSPA
jgi:hypothetical protein